MTHTNVSADSVRTIEWLLTEDTTLVVPAYQRQYRWDVDSCGQLLADVRRIADADAKHTHFLGSILHTVTSAEGVCERLLVDGQQRVTTLMLLLAAIRDTFKESDTEIPAGLDQLLNPNEPGHSRLRLRHTAAVEFDEIVLGRSLPEAEEGISHLRDNHAFFLDAIRDDAARVWRGLRRLEHVAIVLGQHSDPQQVFESLNSTGEPLRDHELIHNYVLMSLTDRQQSEIEDSFWVPIEANTGEAIDSFWRDFLILKTERDNGFTGYHGVYEVFREQYPAPRFESLVEHATEWMTYSQVYRILLNPALSGDAEVGRRLGYINNFGSTLYPLLLGVYRDYQLDRITRDDLLEVLEQLQSLYLRKMVVGASRDHLAAQLCRKRSQYGYPIRALARRMPSDERIREALAHRPLPHAGYVLQRIDELGDVSRLQIEHIFPQFPGESWSGDGMRPWRAFSEVEQAKYREVLSTIGNLVLLEQSLNSGASNKSFPAKREYYRRSQVHSAQTLADQPAWDLESIADRTRDLTDRFLRTWQRPSVAGSDDPEYLVPILDAPRKAGHYKGWKTEFEYATFHEEIWEIRNLKELFRRTFTHLWQTNRAQVLTYSAAHDGPVFETEAWPSRWEPLEGSHYLFLGLFPQYMLEAVQGVLDHMDMADDMFVKYSDEAD